MVGKWCRKAVHGWHRLASVVMCRQNAEGLGVAEGVVSLVVAERKTPKVNGCQPKAIVVSKRVMRFELTTFTLAT